MDALIAVKKQGIVLQRRALPTRADQHSMAIAEIVAALNAVLADVFALYMKTKNFHWHMSGPHFRDYHLLLSEQATQIFQMTDPIAERIRKLGGATLKSVADIGKHQRLQDNDAEYVEAQEMLRELRSDNASFAEHLREAYVLCDAGHDFASVSQIAVWIDETERRTWFLLESSPDRKIT